MRAFAGLVGRAGPGHVGGKYSFECGMTGFLHVDHGYRLVEALPAAPRAPTLPRHAECAT
jgi:hypothetical protein